MGHAVIAVPGRLGHTNHLYELGEAHEWYVGLASQILLDRVDPVRFRHNLGVVNDHEDPLNLTLALGPYGFNVSLEVPPAANTVSLTIPPPAVQVIQLDPLLPASLLTYWPATLSVIADRPAILFVSMVDNLTGDATSVPYTLMYLHGDNESRYAIPAVAILPCEAGSRWRTELYAAWFDLLSMDEGFRDDRPKAFFHPASPAANCGGVAPGAELVTHLQGQLSMPPEHWAGAFPWHTVFPDVVHQFAACAGQDVRGALELRTGSWMSAFARTYTTRADGGTYGEMMPLYPPHGWPVQHFAGIEMSAAFRVNLGLYNGDRDHAIVHRLTLYAADGTSVAEREVTLHPWENDVRRLETWLGIPIGSVPAGTYGLTVLPLDDAAHGVQGRSWAFVSLVDNVTNDPTNWW